VITGRQIRDGRELLGLSQPQLARAAKVPVAALIRAERSDGEPSITIAHVGSIRSALEGAGVVFTQDGEPWVKLKRTGPTDVGRRGSDPTSESDG
jgi:transcriptional regulator with XRE-family HTH domain